jgi:hypothetical protein
MWKRLQELLAPSSLKRESSSDKAFEELFGESFETLQSVFRESLLPRAVEALPAYPRSVSQEKQGLNAVVIQLHIAVSEYARCLSAIRRGYEQVAIMHFQKDTLHSLVTYKDELGGRNIYILTNALELAHALAGLRFGPLPPWELWAHFGPFHSYRQGPEEYWFIYIWEPFWSSLTIEQQDSYFAARRASNREYISDAEWEDWKLRITFGDERRGG